MPRLTLPRSWRTKRSDYLTTENSTYPPLLDHPSASDDPTTTSNSISTLQLDDAVQQAEPEPPHPQPRLQSSRRRRIFGEELRRLYESCSLRGRGAPQHDAVGAAGCDGGGESAGLERNLTPYDALNGETVAKSRAGRPGLDGETARNSVEQSAAEMSSTPHQDDLDEDPRHRPSVRPFEEPRGPWLFDHIGDISDISTHEKAAARVLSLTQEEQDILKEQKRLQWLDRLGCQRNPVIVTEKVPLRIMSRTGRQADDAVTLRPEDSITLRGVASHDSVEDADKQNARQEDIGSPSMPLNPPPEPLVQQDPAATTTDCRSEYHGDDIALFFKSKVEIKDTKDKQLSIYDHADIEIANAKDIKIVNFRNARVKVRGSYRVKVVNIRDARAKVTVQNSKKVSMRHLGYAEWERRPTVMHTRDTNPVDDGDQCRDGNSFVDPDEQGPPKKTTPKGDRLTEEWRAAGHSSEGNTDQDIDVRLFVDLLDSLPRETFDTFRLGKERRPRHDSGCFEFVDFGEGPGPAVKNLDEDLLGWVPMQKICSGDDRPMGSASSQSDASTLVPASSDSNSAPWTIPVQVPAQRLSLESSAAPRAYCPYGSDHSVTINPAASATDVEDPPFPIWLLDLIDMVEEPHSPINSAPSDIPTSTDWGISVCPWRLISQSHLRAGACDSPGPEEYTGE